MIELICIVCPRGCHLNVDEHDSYKVTGHTCTRGVEYGQKEVTAPMRMLTSIVHIEGATHPCCPVKTSSAIPKGEIYNAMDLLRSVVLQSPVSIGDVVVNNICGIGVNWIVTKDM